MQYKLLNSYDCFDISVYKYIRVLCKSSRPIPTMNIQSLLNLSIGILCITKATKWFASLHSIANLNKSKYIYIVIPACKNYSYSFSAW